MVKTVRDLWILNEDGMTIFKRLISSELDPDLFGALLHTLNLMANEISFEHITRLELEDFRFNIIKDQDFFFIADSDKLLKEKKVYKDLEKIKDVFFEKYGDVVLNNWDQDISIFEGFDKIIADHIEDEHIKDDITIFHLNEEEGKKGPLKIEGIENSEATIEAIMRINDLKAAASSYKLQGNYENAIICADHAIRICIQYKLPYDIKEFEIFINSIAKKIEKENLIAQINEYGTCISTKFDKLVKEGSILKARELVKSFKDRYKDIEIFEELEIVQDLIKRSNIEWIKYYVKNNE